MLFYRGGHIIFWCSMILDCRALAMCRGIRMVRELDEAGPRKNCNASMKLARDFIDNVDLVPRFARSRVGFIRLDHRILISVICVLFISQ